MLSERTVGLVVGLVVGYGADRLLGDPRRWHPVAGFGRVASAVEGLTYADRRTAGAAHVAVLVGGTTLVAARLPRRWWVVAAATYTALGGTTLDREAAAVERRLADRDLPGARAQVARLVGRDTTALDEAGVARAVIESVAENTVDAVVSTLVWGAVAGAPGLLAHRAANTLDAMVGHRSPRYARFGTAAARLDDAMNLPGSRLAAALAVLLGDDPRGAARAWRRDARHHPSPNGGPVEAAFAGALGVRLGGVNVYAGRVEDRHVLGDGRPPTHHDVRRARRLALQVDAAALLVTTAFTAITALAPTLARRARRPRR